MVNSFHLPLLIGGAMPDAHHHLLGSYQSPQFDYGDAVFCEFRGEVVITGLTSARIPWPVAKRPGSAGRTLAIYGDLAEAVRRESVLAVCYWWGITPQTVTKWRTAMGVAAMTEGTVLLKVTSATDSVALEAARERGKAKARDPERCEKIAASKRGKPRPQHVIDAMREGRTGKPHTEEVRKLLSELSRRRGARPPKAGRPWTAEEDALVWSLPAAQVAEQTKRTLSAVYTRRYELNVPDGRRRTGK